ncbi:MAG: hypothetical protein LUG12_03825 [Erysipelotrichaceae bacterium]|nr:hypothetical protein [Erysipelotrichaceae bacterium]
MFKNFFAHDDENEDMYETVDTIAEQRRKEKFSEPLIYPTHEDVEEKKEEKVEIKKEENKVKPILETESTYEMIEIISPMTGVKKDPIAKPKVKKAEKPKKSQKQQEQLIPIISPYYGVYTKEEPKEPEYEQKLKKVETIKENEDENTIKESVDKNIRNIAELVEDQQDELKIIEERTGEFKLDFKKDDQNTFIDEIDDSMSLDELMSLYEKKFKD